MEQKLLKMKAEIDDAKAKKNRLEGEMDGIKAQLKEKYGFDTVESAESEVTRLEKEIEEQEEVLTDQMEKLENAYKWQTL